MKKILFICRKYNDLDHSTPLMDCLLSSNKYKVDLLNINLNESFKDDYKILYLKKKYKKKFKEIDLDLFYSKNLLNYFIAKVIYSKKETFLSPIYLLKQTLFKIGAKDILIKKLSVSDINIIDYYNAIIFDHLDLKKLKILNNIFLKYKKKYNTKFISIPHGFSTNSKSKGVEKIKLVFKNLVNFCDLVFFNNKLWYQEILLSGIDKKKTRNFGSLRFTKLWSNILLKNIKIKNPYKSKKVKVLFLGFEKARLRVKNFKKLYQTTLNKISEIKNYEIIFKPPTRTNKIAFANLPYNFKISYDHTVSLIKNCDLVIGHNSGVVFEVFLQNKQYISLRYLRPLEKKYDNVFERFNVCFSPRNLNDFVIAISKKNISNYINSKNKDKFIKKFLNHNSNPFKDYYREINNITNSKN